MRTVRVGALFAPILMVLGLGCGSVMHREFTDPALANAKKLAVLPLENLTASASAGETAAAAIAAKLGGTRLALTDAAATKNALGRVDPPPSSSSDRLIALRVGELLGVDAVLYGSVTEVVTPKDAAVTRPAVGWSVRIVDVSSGKLLFAGTYSASAPDQMADAIAAVIGK